ncbi:hypothetical protein KXX10_004085, partial [Aspergillus fumigatus]
VALWLWVIQQLLLAAQFLLLVLWLWVNEEHVVMGDSAAPPGGAVPPVGAVVMGE